MRSLLNSYVIERGRELRKLCRDITKNKSELEYFISMFESFENDRLTKDKISDCKLFLKYFESFESPKEIILNSKNKKDCPSLYQFFYQDTNYITKEIKKSNELITEILSNMTGLNLEYE